MGHQLGFPIYLRRIFFVTRRCSSGRIASAQKRSLNGEEIRCALVRGLGVDGEGLVQKDGARLLLEETTANVGEGLVKLEPFFLPPGETLTEQEELSLKPEERRPKLVKTFLPAEETLLEQEEPSLPRPEDLSGQEETSTKAEEDRHNLMEASL